MFYWYISLEYSFVSYDYGTNVGRGFILDWLDRENLLQEMRSTFEHPIKKNQYLTQIKG